MKKKAVVFLVIAVLAVAFGVYLYDRIAAARGKKGEERRRGGAVAVETSPVRKQTIRDVGRFTGSLFPRTQFVVAPKVAGRLVKLEVDVGDSVKPGQLIATLDDEEYVRQVEQARAELDVATASVGECKTTRDVGEKEFNRINELNQLKPKIASDSDLDQARANFKVCEARYDVALAQVKQRQAALKAAEVRLSYTPIRATWENGPEPRVVGERFVDQGAMLRANDPIVSILDVRTLTAIIYVIERDYPRVQVGQTVVVTTDAFAERSFAGKVARIAPLLKETSRQARIEVDIPNAETLLTPGMFVRAEIEFARHEGATVVPVAAVATRGGKQGVFLADTKALKVRFVPVKLGITEGDASEVLEPALAGAVITLGQHLLEDNSAIILPGATPPDRWNGPLSPGTTAAGKAEGGK